MKLLFNTTLLLLMAGLARADIVIVESVGNGAQSTQMTVKVNGDRVRADISPMVSTITDASTGSVIACFTRRRLT